MLSLNILLNSKKCFVWLLWQKKCLVQKYNIYTFFNFLYVIKKTTECKHLIFL